MKRILPTLLAVVQVICLLFGCGGTPLPEQTNAPEDMQTAPERTAAAVCMGSVSHPAHRIVQLGFMEKAEELGYEGHILGLDTGSMQELYDCWLEGAKEHDIAGAVCWVGDDSAYECLKELHGMGVKIVASCFPHAYESAKDIIDVNLFYDNDEMEVKAAEFLGQKLRAADIRSGSIGLAVTNLCVLSNDLHAFRNHFENNYPEYKLLDLIGVGAEIDSSKQKIEEYILAHPDMVAGFGAQGGGPVSWSSAKKSTGRTDIMVVGYEYTPTNLNILMQGGVDALVALPVYDSGARGMELVDELVNGKVFNLSEATWRISLDTPLIYPDGAGAHDPAYYYDQYARSEMRFGQ